MSSSAPQPTRRVLPSRRTILKTIGGVAAVAGVGGAGYYLTRDKVTIGLIGCGGRGSELAKICKLYGYYGHRYLNIAAVADVNRPNAEKVKELHASGADVYQDYRRLLDRKDIEAVVIATTDQHHVPIALAAIAAGKDVYLEKPFSHTVQEGRKLVSAVNQSKQVLLVGMQQRNDARFRTAAELVRQGRLGRMQKIIVSLAGKSPLGGPFVEKPVPDGLDWDAWLGPAPTVPYCPERHLGWHSWWDYGGGEMTNWGVHHLDIVQWALNATGKGPTRIESACVLPNIPNGYEAPADFTARLTYPNDIIVEIKTLPNDKPPETNNGIEFIGDQGSVFVNRSRIEGEPYNSLGNNPLNETLHSSPAVWNRTTVRHLAHFAACVRRHEQPIADAEAGQQSSNICNLVNIAQRLGRPLQWNPDNEVFENDTEANRYLDKTRRLPL